MDNAYARAVRQRETATTQRVLVSGIYRDATQMLAARDELARSTHRLEWALGAMGDTSPELEAETVATQLSAGKFQNINALLDLAGHDYDWLLLLDDDIDLPPGFLDRMVAVSTRLDFALSQPAQTRQSHANWSVTRRRALRVARQTRFVEIGPATLVRRDAAQLLLPFPPDLRYGWGLDFHWAHVMAEAGLRSGVVDSAAVVHASQPVASTYSWDAAQEEGRAFLASVPHLPTDIAHQTVRSHRYLR